MAQGYGCARRGWRAGVFTGLLRRARAGTEKRVQLSREHFALLIGGIDLVQTRERKWYRRGVDEESAQSRKSA